VLAVYIQSYFRKYSRPPKKLILSYIEKHKNQFADDIMYQSLKNTLVNSAESIDELLDKYESQYIIDDAELYIKAASLKNTMDEINLALENDDEASAMRIYEKMIIPEVQRSNIITFEDDLDKQREVLRKNRNLIILFKNEIGKLTGPLFRGDFFSFASPTGVGKTWWLMWTAKQCRDQGLNVLFLSLEMQEQSIIRRFQQMYYRRTLYGEEVRIAKFIQDDDNKYKIVHKKINAEQLKPEDINELKVKAIGKHPHGRLKIVCRAGINISELKAILSELKYQDRFIPDAVILDYADKMTTAKKVSTEREALGIIWKDLRDLALDQNLLLVTASQTNRASWDKHFTREAIAEDSRKLNEATCAVGIMADKRDRELGLLMLRLLKVRDGYYENRDVYCSCNYHIGQPVLQSVWVNELVIPDNSAAAESADKSPHGIQRRRGIRKK
jgi:replicative DNA helicase